MWRLYRVCYTELLLISNACAIPDDENDQVYITGGSAQEIVRFPTYLSLETVSGLS